MFLITTKLNFLVINIKALNGHNGPLTEDHSLLFDKCSLMPKIIHELAPE
jgi:hypothetical protein